MFRRRKNGKPYGNWYCRHPVTGRKHSLETDDKARAKEKLRRLEEEAHEREMGRYVERWEETSERWMELNQHLASRRSQDEYHAFWLKHLTGFRLTEISAEMVHSIIRSERPINLKEGTPANATANNYVQFVGKIMRFGKVVPPSFYKYPAPEDEREWLRPEQWPLLRDALPDDARRVCTFALATGLRIENVLRFEWSWIHGDSAFLPKDVTKTKQSYGVPLNRTALGVIAEIRALPVRSHTLLFIHNGAEWKYPTLLKALKSACKRATLPRITPHSLRHTFGAWITMEGVSDAIRRRLGCWRLPKGADSRYVHFDVERLRRFSEMLDPLLCPTSVTTAPENARESSAVRIL
jgi:integrase